jgi:hypothetical protein
MRFFKIALSQLAACAVLQGATYYIDATGGSNTNSGTSIGAAWETLARASAQAYSPGDRILLKRGETFSGFLDLRGESGSDGNPILVGDYGTSPDRAVIDAAGESVAINLGNTEYIEIENLEITGAGLRGTAFAWTSPGKVWDHYHLRNLHIHDTANSAINFYVSNLGGYRFKDISVSDCVIENIGGYGIQVNKWAGEAVKTVKNIGPADSNRAPGTYTNVTADNLTRTQVIPALFTVIVDGAGAASITPTEKGAGYQEDDQLVFADAVIGGGGAADLTCQVGTTQPADPNAFYHEDLVIRGNTILNTNAAGMQFGKIRNGIVEDNVVTNPGRDYDAAGSGLWVWFCGTPATTFIVQDNTFTGAQGDTDSCGAHIDIGCVNTIFQYNLSRENQGGFMEILGKAYNCVYRYNISINDGIREAATNPYQADGRTLFLGGYTGRGGPQEGPYNSYIYNNTIYTQPEILSKYSIAASASGALFANNIIYVTGTATEVTTPGDTGGESVDIIFDNNLVYQNKVPTSPWNSYINNWDADPVFLNPGGLNAADYEPLNKDEVVNAAIDLYMVPGDPDGVAGGFAVTQDFFGNPIIGQPDMGAIEADASVHWLVDNSLSGSTDMNLDVSGDGVTLLEAYAFNLDPNRNNAGNMPKLKPSAGGNTMEMSFYGQATGVIYDPLKSTNLQQWFPVDSGWLSGPDGGGIIMVTIPSTELNPSLFLRLQLGLE